MLPELRAVGVALYIELVYRVHAKEHSAWSARRHIVFRSSSKLHAVEQEKILLWTISRNRKVVSRAGIRNAGSAGLLRGKVDNAGIERQEQVVASPVQRKLLDLLGTDQAGDITCCGVHDWRIFGNCDSGL